jgi:hypothetical protein
MSRTRLRDSAIECAAVKQRLTPYLQHSGPGNCTDALNGDVKDSLENTDVPGDEESARDGWVDVAPAHVPHSLEQ